MGLPPSFAGVGLKSEHYRAALESTVEGLWFEVHPENYMVAGGPRLAWLDAIRARRPISFHGVAASLAGPDPLDEAHLKRLRALVSRFEPALISEHVAWSAAGGVYYGDLFPLPYTQEAARHLIDRIDQFQSALGRRILIENPASYLALRCDMSESAFLAEVCAHSGCGLLLDVNNIFVSANNTGFDARAYVDAIDGALIGEVHIAGHEADAASGRALLIDSHAAPVAAPVWALYERLIARIGPRPTLLERDARVPPFSELMEERARAADVLSTTREAA